MEIRTLGVGERMRECEGLLQTRLASAEGRLILLPIPTSQDNKYINSTDIRLSSAASFVNGSTAVAGYNIPSEIREAAEKCGAPIFDAGEDEDFLLENAALTAKGTLGYILTHFNRDIADLSFGVVGYGRIGKEMLRLLLLLGARVSVFTTREAVALELGEMGVEAQVISDSLAFEKLDILINTAPAVCFKEELLPKELEIIDLASGSIFEPSQRLTKLSGVPDKMYPRSAGRLYAEAILRFLEGEGVI